MSHQRDLGILLEPFVNEHGRLSLRCRTSKRKLGFIQSLDVGHDLQGRRMQEATVRVALPTLQEVDHQPAKGMSNGEIAELIISDLFRPIEGSCKRLMQVLEPGGGIEVEWTRQSVRALIMRRLNVG